MKLEYTNEVWKDIKGYEGLYAISNLGRVKSLERRVWNGKVWYVVPERILKPFKAGKGYFYICLCNNGTKKKYSIHRLVAMTFLPNPENKPCVDHRDGNPENCAVFNLRWCTYEENNNFELYRTRQSNVWEKPEYKAKMSVKMKIAQNKSETKKKRSVSLTNHPLKSKPVQQFTLQGEFVADYPSIKEAKRQTGIDDSHIGQCCKGNPKFSTAGGYIWKYKEEVA